MDFKNILDTTNVVLTYPPFHDKAQIIDIIKSYYRGQVKWVFTSCRPTETNYSYSDDVSFVMAMQSKEGWVIIDDYLDFYNSKLIYRINEINARGKGVIILSTFGINSIEFAPIESLVYQQAYLDMIQTEGLTWEILTSDPLCRLLSLGLYPNQKTAVFTSNVGFMDRQLLPLNYPILTWSFDTPINEKLLVEYERWKENKDGLFIFCDVPPLNLDQINNIYFVDGWNASSIWATLYQSYIQVFRKCPLNIVVAIQSDEQKAEYNKFMLEYDNVINIYNRQRNCMMITVNPKTKSLTATI